jgi:hypothetical protein
MKKCRVKEVNYTENISNSVLRGLYGPQRKAVKEELR